MLRACASQTLSCFVTSLKRARVCVYFFLILWILYFVFLLITVQRIQIDWISPKNNNMSFKHVRYNQSNNKICRRKKQRTKQ